MVLKTQSMAIIDELGLQATILISGHPATEYPDTENASDPDQFGPNTKKSYSYAQCTDNAEFSIKCEVTSPNQSIRQWLADHDHAIRFKIDIDGGKINKACSIRRSAPSRTVEGVSDSANGLLRKFRFTSVSTGMWS